MAQTLEDKSIWEDGEESLGEEVLRMSTDEIVSRTRLMDNEIKIMKSEVMRITHEIQAQNEKIKDNTEKIKVSAAQVNLYIHNNNYNDRLTKRCHIWCPMSSSCWMWILRKRKMMVLLLCSIISARANVRLSKHQHVRRISCQ